MTTESISESRKLWFLLQCSGTGNPCGWEGNGVVISDSPFAVDGTARVGMQHLEKGR